MDIPTDQGSLLQNCAMYIYLKAFATKIILKVPKYLLFLVKMSSIYRKVANRSMCYYSGNQVFGGATNRDMPLNKT